MSYGARLYDFEVQQKSRPARRRTWINATAQPSAGVAHAVIVHNVSVSGILAECADVLHQGSSVLFDLPHVGQVPARIVWRGERLYGCEFEQALAPEDLDKIDHRKVIWADFSGLAQDAPLASAPTAEPVAASPEHRLTSRARLAIIVACALACWALFALPVMLIW